MEPEPGNPPNDLLDRVSALLEQVLQTPANSQPDVLAELCARHPDCAAALRQGYGSLENLDLLQVGQAPPAGSEPAPITGGLPRTLGPFRLLELLGAGGMGAVYRAEDEELKRPVALKLVRSELLASVRTRSRFQRESAALARLDHPGLCTVYRAGVTNGQPWIAMRLVRGTTLAAAIEARLAAQEGSRGKTSSPTRGSSSTREELQSTLLVFEKIARALATAHAAGVVHRDIKPANIVLTSGDEPVVIDFGLVHLEDSASHLTISGDHIGTPAYMAPEQVEPAGREPGPHTDVYALGVTLFEALTLQSPYHSHSREELFHGIVRGERRRLRQVRRSLTTDLELVVEKALDVEPARRYASMLDFAEDLRRVRQHEPPAARRIGPALRLRRWCQRNPVATTFLTLLSLGLGTALVLDAQREAARQHSLAMAYGNLAGQLIDENPEHALDLALLGVEKAPGDPESLGLLLRVLQEVQPREAWPLRWPKSPRPEVRNLIVAPAGDAALVLGGFSNNKCCAPILWRDGAMTILDIENGTLDVSWAPDGNQFVTTGPESPPQLWTATGELLTTFKVPDATALLRIPRARFLPDGKHILFACSDGMARIHTPNTDTWIKLIPPLCLQPRDGMPGIAVSADGQRIALGDSSGCLVVHETAEAMRGKQGSVLTTSGPAVLGIDLSAKGELLQVQQLRPHSCSVWSWGGDRLASWGTEDAPASLAPLDPTRNRVLELRQDSPPLLWRFDGTKLLLEHTLAGHLGRVSSAHFAPDGSILTTGVDGTARVWDADTGRTEMVLRGFDHELRTGAFLGAGESCLLVTLGAVHRFDLRRVAGPRLRVGNFRDLDALFLGPAWPGPILTADDVRRFSFHDAAGQWVRDFPDKSFLRRAGIEVATSSRWLASTSHSRKRQTVARIYAPSLEVTEIPELPMAEPIPIWGPEDQLLLVDSVPDEPGASVLHVQSEPGRWQLAPDEAQQRFAEATAGTEAFAYHARTATLALAKPGAAATLYRWSASPPALQQTQVLLPGMNKAHKLAFSPNGKYLLLACRDRVVRLVDLSNPDVPLPITGHIGSIVDVGISPHGDRLLIAASESGVMVYDLERHLILPIRATGGVTCAVFLPDGERILFGTTARETRIVPIVPEELVKLARGVRKPTMSADYLQSYKLRVGDDGDH